MPIRGDRLRWPPRPGKRSADAASSARRSPASGHPADTQSPDIQSSLQQQPNGRDESADQPSSPPHNSTQQAHADVANDQQDTGRRNQAGDIKRNSC